MRRIRGKTMNILGLHINTGQTAAALLQDGVIRAAAAEERFDRIKQSRAFPRKAIAFCLKEAGLDSIEELDGVAVSWNPAENMRHINLSGFTQWRRYDPEWLYIVPNHLLTMKGAESQESDVLTMDLGTKRKCRIYFVEHHRAHLAHAICHSPFDKGLAVIVDEYGEYYSVTIARFRKEKLEIIKRIAYPNSLGVFYAAMTEYLGFTPNSDEWKVMGAAACGNPKRFQKKLETILQWDKHEGEWVLDTRYIEHSNMKRAGYLNEHVQKLIGIPVRTESRKMGREYFDLAASAQAVFEKRIFELLTFYGRKTGETNLAVSGGCFMNSLANGKIICNTQFKRLFIPYAAADNGGAMGSTLYVHTYLMGHLRKMSSAAATPFLGPAFIDNDVKNALTRYGLRFSKIDDPSKYAAEEIASGRLVGWFQGRMEFGERALGNRSILADPRDLGMKDRINAAVKYREHFRPFAPSVLADKADQFFELPSGAFVPYMEQVYPVKKEKRCKIPAVVHADGTGRLQMVTREMNERFYDLIKAFERQTGIPVVINTSFNVQGEPIVCTPNDAIRTFFTCGLDVLIMGNYVVMKQGQDT